jgi:hypothetical protein
VVSLTMPSPNGGRLALLQHTEGSNVWLLGTSERFPECWNVSKQDCIQPVSLPCGETRTPALAEQEFVADVSSQL